MKPLAVLVAVTCLTLTLAAASASADTPVSDPQIQAWVGIARGYWHVPPGQADPTVVSGDTPESYWGWSEIGLIRLDRDVYPWRPSVGPRRWWDAAMCSVIVHEYGHTLGYDHTSDPRDVMFPTVPINAIPYCPWYQADVQGRLVELHRRREHHAAAGWLSAPAGERPMRAALRRRGH